MPHKPRLAFIGGGALATTLAPALATSGYPVIAVASRTESSAQTIARLIPGAKAYPTAQEAADQAELIFITTPDSEVRAVAAAIAWRPNQTAIHCSGAHGPDLLGTIRAGAAVLHPLQTFPTRTPDPSRLHGCYAAVQGDPSTIALLEQIARDLRMHPVRVPPEHTALYHAAAVLASNYTVTLMALAASLWAPLGVERKEAVQALLPLMKATIENLETVGLPNALTGPIARGDADTVARHLQALQQHAPGIAMLYQELAKLTLPLAQEKGTITLRAADKLRRLLPD